jgi:hypothetical protein
VLTIVLFFYFLVFFFYLHCVTASQLRLKDTVITDLRSTVSSLQQRLSESEAHRRRSRGSVVARSAYSFFFVFVFDWGLVLFTLLETLSRIPKKK